MTAIAAHLSVANAFWLQVTTLTRARDEDSQGPQAKSR
jgi:hypothetical protein